MRNNSQKLLIFHTKFLEYRCIELTNESPKNSQFKMRFFEIQNEIGYNEVEVRSKIHAR